jgi:REP element-mobilizing transposase RayT
MARQRKKHIQQSFQYRTHGGKREGAGRPSKRERPSEPHAKRDDVDPRYPIHVSTRVVGGLGSLRKKDIFEAIRGATLAIFERHAGFHLVEASIQFNHLHLLVEAKNKDALSGGMQAFLVSCAKRINRALYRRTGNRRRGSVFEDRYHGRVLKTPRQVRNTIAYVLNNFRRHGEDRAPFALNWKVDPYSTGVYFMGWAELGDSPFLFTPPPRYCGLMTWLPKTWLLRVGWKFAPPISLWAVPGPIH